MPYHVERKIIDGERYWVQKVIPHKKCEDAFSNEISDVIRDSASWIKVSKMFCITEFDENDELKGNF